MYVCTGITSGCLGAFFGRSIIVFALCQLWKLPEPLVEAICFLGYLLYVCWTRSVQTLSLPTALFYVRVVFLLVCLFTQRAQTRKTCDVSSQFLLFDKYIGLTWERSNMWLEVRLIIWFQRAFFSSGVAKCRLSVIRLWCFLLFTHTFQTKCTLKKMAVVWEGLQGSKAVSIHFANTI